jgi:hypothetical protein
METGGIVPPFLILALDGGERSASGRFTAGGKWAPKEVWELWGREKSLALP